MIWIMIVAMLVYLGGNLYIFIRALQAMSTLPPAAHVLFGILFWIAAIALFLSIGLRNMSLPSVLFKSLFTVGSIWMVFTLYMVVSMGIMDVVHLFIPGFNYGFYCALAVTLSLLVYGYVNYRNPSVERIELSSSKLPAGECYRVAVVSDVHLGYGTNRADLARYVDMINEYRPDAVVIVGDLIDNSTKPVEQDDMCCELERIQACDGIFLVPGNHEYISGIENVERYIRTTPIVLLKDSIVGVGPYIELVGRDDRMNRHRATLEELMSRCDRGKVNIVLDHQPYAVRESASLGADAYLAGHTHRGQVWPLSWAVDAMYDQSHGVRMWGNTMVYVSSGLSLWGPPFRIGTQSELAIIDICGK